MYILCTSLICLLPFTCLPVGLRTTFEGGTSIPMKGFSCSIGGEGALLTLEGPDADLALRPSAIRLKTAPRLPTTELVRLPLDPTRLSTCSKFGLMVDMLD